ncbi:MAG TPA: SpoIIE family protein phosphatase [Gemmatimonadales bacterium]|nr:SpoIIE family protein phosphatase [Gemmatimonadales bacterium]
MSSPPSIWQTTQSLRVPAKLLIVGRADADGDGFGMRVAQGGYIVDGAGQAGDAFEKLRAERFDVVLLDVHAPGVDGPGFIEGLRNDPELAHVPVIVVSASEDMAAIEQCLELGADDHLPRAFSPAVLRARVSAALDRRRLRDAQSLKREMSVARNIQRDFLPESLPAARGVQLAAALHPARQVSGDFYDAFMLAPSGNILLVVGDVCDKGVGAALFMALFRSLIRASADPVEGGAIQMIGGRRTLVRESLEAATPADLLTRVAGFTNNYIARLHGRTNMFATVFMAVLNPFSGDLSYVNAGHEPALVIGPDGLIRELRPTGPALGLLADADFSAAGLTLERGHCLLAFTDGLVEARSPAGEAYGDERLRDVLRAGSGASASDLVQRVTEALEEFTRQAEPHDDLTLLVATRTMG